MTDDRELDPVIARPVSPNPYDLLPARPPLVVTSSDVRDGEPLAMAHVADGGNTSPQLSWSGAPAGTGSYVVTCFDPDAPTPSGFWHWAIIDLPADCTSLPTGAGAEGAALPGGAFMLRNDAGQAAFMGAAPPSNDQVHRYYFAVHAVGTDTLGIDASASCAVASFNLAFKATARGYVVGTYAH